MGRITKEATESPSSSLIITDAEAAKFERGFKTRSENLAASLRETLNVKRVDPLPPRSLADHLGVFVLLPGDLDLPPESHDYLLSPEGNEWSAAAVRACDMNFIVINPTHTLARQSNDMMHELAHILLRHEPAQVVISHETGVGLRGFNVRQEAEANWLAASLLLPREALVYCLKQKMDHSQICERFQVSPELTRYRINVTGAARQCNR